MPGVSWLLNLPAVHHPQPRTSGIMGEQNWITSFYPKPPMTPITSRRKLTPPTWPGRFSRLVPPILSLHVSDPLFCHLTFDFSPAVTLASSLFYFIFSLLFLFLLFFCFFLLFFFKKNYLSVSGLSCIAHDLSLLLHTDSLVVDLFRCYAWP